MSIASNNIKDEALVIKHNKEIAKDTYEMVLTGGDFKKCEYGQFINLKVDNGFLRRPISICNFNEEELVIVYKAVGCGTRKLAQLQAGTTIDTLYPLGTGYQLPADSAKEILLVGGGIGLPPLLGWSKHLENLGKYNVRVIAGFQSEDDVFYQEEFTNLEPVIQSEDGTVIDYMDKHNINFDYYYSCGPMGMLKALAKKNENGQLLLEARMACGVGACMGCSVKTGKESYKRVCVEGPMFYASEVNYED